MKTAEEYAAPLLSSLSAVLPDATDYPHRVTRFSEFADEFTSIIADAITAARAEVIEECAKVAVQAMDRIGFTSSYGSEILDAIRALSTGERGGE